MRTTNSSPILRFEGLGRAAFCTVCFVASCSAHSQWVSLFFVCLLECRDINISGTERQVEAVTAQIVGIGDELSVERRLEESAAKNAAAVFVSSESEESDGNDGAGESARDVQVCIPVWDCGCGYCGMHAGETGWVARMNSRAATLSLCVRTDSECAGVSNNEFE